MPEQASFLEGLRQQAVIGLILGIRQGIAMATPTGREAVIRDERAAETLLAAGNYQRAFEIATGFGEYFEINRHGKAIGSSGNEIAAVMVGHATGFNQAVEAVKGENRSGDKLTGFDRFATGLDALLRLASTVMTVVGGVEFGLRTTGKVLSPVYRIGPRDVVIVETSLGRQAFYRSTGKNSGMPGEWLPVDEFWPANGWFNKLAYVEGPGLQYGTELHRYGNHEFKTISKRLGRMSIPEGQPVPPGQREVEEMTLNRILDFFGARKTETTVIRPVPEK